MTPSRKPVTCGDEAGREMENALHNVKRDGVVRPRFADAGREDETKDSAARFLVGVHGAEQSRGRKAWPGRQRSQAANQRDDAGNVVGARQAKFVPEEGRSDHAPGYGFTVLIAAVFRHAFEGMCEGVTEIEDFPQARLAFVAAHHARFDLHVAGIRKPSARRSRRRTLSISFSRIANIS